MDNVFFILLAIFGFVVIFMFIHMVLTWNKTMNELKDELTKQSEKLEELENNQKTILAFMLKIMDNNK